MKHLKIYEVYLKVAKINENYNTILRLTNAEGKPSYETIDLIDKWRREVNLKLWLVISGYIAIYLLILGIILVNIKYNLLREGALGFIGVILGSVFFVSEKNHRLSYELEKFEEMIKHAFILIENRSKYFDMFSDYRERYE